MFEERAELHKGFCLFLELWFWVGGRMGHSSKKKKRGGGGSGKKKKASKDHGAYVGDDDNELLSEEITAL